MWIADRRRILYTLLASGAAAVSGYGTAAAAPPQITSLQPGAPSDLVTLERAVSAALVTRSANGTGIALTFDDGPGPETDDILDILHDTGVRAVFCVIGRRAQEYPRLVRRIVNEGHLLGNHSWDHDHAKWKQGTTAAEYERDLLRATAAIRRAAPGARIPFFRAPFGAWGPDRIAARVGAGMGMTPLSWSRSVADWSPTVSRETILQRVSAAGPGEVVLLHDADDRGIQDRKRTVWATRRAIPNMRQAGRKFDVPMRNPRV
ncbi:polysaccharide deacetylase family protein [Glycomyces tritici]|uniref:Polysaccharide deacetylase family protein n=1 Tax=Glycomyces tritici TaxID=2665176 RepID=A0ABT7YQU4_9ACTN|nr:polysaccharide deacetylase family protein [Glycomyces tritici]MDN3240769.1 polysaccharide deacetylase family protein [Glycomyces tritici]